MSLRLMSWRVYYAGVSWYSVRGERERERERESSRSMDSSTASSYDTYCSWKRGYSGWVCVWVVEVMLCGSCPCSIQPPIDTPSPLSLSHSERVRVCIRVCGCVSGSHPGILTNLCPLLEGFSCFPPTSFIRWRSCVASLLHCVCCLKVDEWTAPKLKYEESAARLFLSIKYIPWNIWRKPFPLQEVLCLKIRAKRKSHISVMLLLQFVSTNYITIYLMMLCKNVNLQVKTLFHKTNMKTNLKAQNMQWRKKRKKKKHDKTRHNNKAVDVPSQE